MDKNEHIFWEVKNEKNYSFVKRLKSVFFNILIWLTIGFFVVLLAKGAMLSLLLGYLFLLIIGFIYSIIVVRICLCSIRFFSLEDKIEVVVKKYNSVEIFYLKRDQALFFARQDFASRATLWKLYITDKGGKRIVQKDVCGWTKEMFVAIAEQAKKYKLLKF